MMNKKQMLAAIQGGAAFVISSSAMGASSYRIRQPDGSEVAVNKMAAYCAPLGAMRCIERSVSRQVWVAKAR